MMQGGEQKVVRMRPRDRAKGLGWDAKCSLQTVCTWGVVSFKGFESELLWG